MSTLQKRYERGPRRSRGARCAGCSCSRCDGHRRKRDMWRADLAEAEQIKDTESEEAE